MSTDPLNVLLPRALAARAPLFDAAHESACRLFNGFTEGCPALAIDLYATTVVIHNHAEPPEDGAVLVAEAVSILRTELPWLRTGLIKTRHGASAAEKRGVFLFGDTADHRVREHGVWYAVDLTMNRDASLYLDTRNLRHWLITHMEGRSVLNTFAYTGSLGVAARAGGASTVAQLDHNHRFLDLARQSYALNGWSTAADEVLTGDFFPALSQLKRAGRRFDCVILDPPFFAVTANGTVDLARDSVRLINKVRPLINDGGILIAVNNALFVRGQDYREALDQLCGDGYLTIAELIPIATDFTGTDATRTALPLVDPAPFNHSTKIAVLQVRRKAG